MLEKVHGTEAWHRYLKEELSPSTAKTYLRTLNRFCEKYGITPEDLLSMSSNKVVALLTDFAENGEKEGSIRPVIFAVKSWLKFNGKPIYVNIPLQNRATISQDDFKKILTLSPLRTRVVISLAAFSGIPLTAIGNTDGTDGLRLGDIIDLDVKTLNFKKVPVLITVRSELCQKHYITFASRLTCNYILLYLRNRREQGEKLTEVSPLVGKKEGMFINTAYTCKLISDEAKRRGFSFPPRALQEYFRAGLQKAVSSQLVPVEYAEVWVGNREVESSALPFDVLEDMRSKFDYMARLHLEPQR